MGFRIGLDIGIASVGWCLLDDENKIINAGVRLFEEAKSDENQKRRERRSSRRLLRRRQHRLERLKDLLFNYRIIENKEYDFYTNEILPYEIRKKGLYNQLTNRELAIALFHLIKRRGAGEFNIETSSKDEEDTKNILSNNENKLKSENLFVCELQLELLKENKKIRGIKNNFKTTSYIREARQILNTQKNYFSQINDEFIEEYINILEGRRKYYQGPGQASPYSWKNEEEWMDKLVGNCSYFPEELRMVKNSYTSELFNLLNDLNNLSLKREENNKLIKDEKVKLIEIFKNTKEVSLKTVAKALKIDANDISGYRINKDNKAIFTSLKSYIEINKIYNCDDIEILDEIGKIATYYQDPSTRKNKYQELFSEKNIIMDEEIIDKLSNNLKYTGTHSLSKKAMNLIMEELLETSKNQMELFTEKGIVPYKMDFRSEKYKYIPKSFIDEWVVSPVVKRSMGQSINVVNEILKTYGTPDEIVIELAREKNSDEVKNRKKEIQKRNENEKNEISKLLEDRKLDKKYFELLRYWKKQDGRCMYSNDYIPIENLIENPNAYEIDHIIPRSISFDDSQDNKVLVKRIENQNKGQRSPYEYFSSSNTKRSYEEFKKQVLEMYNKKMISMKKRDNLLLEEEISKYSSNFIARNLVDTRYATRELMNLLRRFFIDKEKHVKIKSIKGSFTSQIRKQWGLTKLRDVSHIHHAQDAFIILMGEKILNNLRWVKEYYHKDENIRYHIKTGEILDDKSFRELFNYDYSKIIKNYKDFKFSYFVDKKPNRQLMNETIYSTRKYKETNEKGKIIEKEYVIGKISNIYDKNSKIVKYFSDEKLQKELLMYHNDRQTFDKMLKIFNEYGGKNSKINPFTKYFEEFGFITKYAKKNNGSSITNLKYRVSQLGNCLDITHKYNTEKKRIIMDTIPTYRADIYYNGKEYKFISTRYLMLKDKGNYYEIDSEKYKNEKLKKGIDENYKFEFSLYNGSIIKITKKDETFEKLRFKGVNNDTTKRIEVNLIDKNYGNVIDILKESKELLKNNKKYQIENIINLIFDKNLSSEEAKVFLDNFSLSSKQKFMTIGKDIIKLEKIHVDMLGKEYVVKEKFENIIKK